MRFNLVLSDVFPSANRHAKVRVFLSCTVTCGGRPHTLVTQHGGRVLGFAALNHDMRECVCVTDKHRIYSVHGLRKCTLEPKAEDAPAMSHAAFERIWDAAVYISLGVSARDVLAGLSGLLTVPPDLLGAFTAYTDMAHGLPCAVKDVARLKGLRRTLFHERHAPVSCYACRKAHITPHYRACVDDVPVHLGSCCGQRVAEALEDLNEMWVACDRKRAPAEPSSWVATRAECPPRSECTTRAERVTPRK